ncbi:hypothetical protein Tco_0706988 [Tanacetum coccineum]|uniref:Uncharacterized protein n=1 Tax=Tanacetum coccineum TaxID=301880 RepID=A0ABQ4Y9U9_9ASTR
MLKAYAKDLKKISKIIWKANESLPNLKERWVSESNVIPNVPKLMQISSFMSLHKCPELSKRFSDNIPKTVDEMLKRVDDYVRLEEAFHDKELRKGEFQQKETQALHRPHQDFRHLREYHIDNRVVLTLDSVIIIPKEILATKHQLCLPQPPPLVGAPIKENLNKLNHLVEDRKRKSMMVDEEWMNVPITFLPVFMQDLSGEAPMVEVESGRVSSPKDTRGRRSIYRDH